ncbi:MAG: radical SAM family heme chaperone HemW [Succinivibrionaceae bacterium]|nr:radical SAM family heme chaperone HemW [Succinivibrionaceae bacterium]
MPAAEAQGISLYAHYPFCVRKCPYCDFFSLPLGGDPARDEAYLEALRADFARQAAMLGGSPRVATVFLGGGTPTLASRRFLGGLLGMLEPHLLPGAEISVECNPGTIGAPGLRELRAMGFTRLSVGAQSLDDRCLRALGRIHGREAAVGCIKAAAAAGFQALNVDLMHGIPGQGVGEALADLGECARLGATHLSWYELTLEPGTPFGRHPPALPGDDERADLEAQGFAALAGLGFTRYEISAFSRGGRCRHNQNYWEFGDYLGIGAGAHAKLTVGGRILRKAAPEDLRAYLGGDFGQFAPVPAADLPFEYLLNRLRLLDPLDLADFTRRTGLPASAVEGGLGRAAGLGLVRLEGGICTLTSRGVEMLNSVLELFLP